MAIIDIFHCVLNGNQRSPQCYEVDRNNIWYNIFMNDYCTWQKLEDSKWAILEEVSLLYESVSIPFTGEIFIEGRLMYTYLRRKTSVEHCISSCLANLCDAVAQFSIVCCWLLALSLHRVANVVQVHWKMWSLGCHSGTPWENRINSDQKDVTIAPA